MGRKVAKSGLPEPVAGKPTSDIAPAIMKIISKKVGSLEASISSWAAVQESFDDTQSQLQTYMCFKEQCTSHWFCYI